MLRILERSRNISSRPSPSPSTSDIPFGPFNSATQRRWKKKPADTARTRLENRTRDLKLDKLKAAHKKLNLVLKLLDLMSNRRGPFVSVQLVSRWKNILGLNVPAGAFLRKYPHVFEVFPHPKRKNPCCRTTATMAGLIAEEESLIRALESESVQRVKRLLTMSASGVLRVHALRLARRELGLPQDFRDSILAKHSSVFNLVDLETVMLAGGVPNSGRVVEEVEKWREKEYREKWLSEFETKYAFPVSFPTGFKKEAGFKERLNNWQRLPYVKPYGAESIQVRHWGGVERREKRVVGILHEFLSLTVEKMVEVDQLVHFRKDFGMEVNLRELLLKHPGIFYISTKGNTQTVFLREAFQKGCLIEPNPICLVRRKMLELVFLGNRNIRSLKPQEGIEEKSTNLAHNEDRGGRVEGDWVLQMFGSFDNSPSEVDDLSENEPHGFYAK